VVSASEVRRRRRARLARNLSLLLPTAAGFCGLVAIIVGVWLVSEPAALIVGGIFTVLLTGAWLRGET
jgi:hypothetical protein